MTLMLLGVSAFASPATSDSACVGASAATLPACECVFKSDASDWENFGDELNPSGTCYEFTTIVNAVPSANRATALQRMTQVGDYMACYSHRDFSRGVVWPGGFPWVVSQLLETMEEDECGLGAGLGALRNVWREGDDWMVGGDKGEHLLWVDYDRNYPNAVLERVWQIDEDGDKQSDDMVLYWDDGRIWIAYDYASIARLNPPDEEEEQQEGDKK